MTSDYTSINIRLSTVIPEIRFSNTKYADVFGLLDSLQSYKAPFV